MSDDFFMQFIPGGEEPTARLSQETFDEITGAPSVGRTAMFFSSGANRGLANMAGLPVDAITGIINEIAGEPRYLDMGVDPETGRPTIAPNQDRRVPIEAPVGGSESLQDALSPFITEDQPQNAWERYAEAIGEDVGASILPVGAALRGAQAPMGLLRLEAASSVGSGVGQQAAEDMGGGPVAQFLGGLLGGGAPIAASRLMREAPQAPTIGDLRDRADAAYERVRGSSAQIDPQSRDDLRAALQATTRDDMLDEVMHPNAYRALQVFDERVPQNATVADLDRFRQFISNNVAGSSVSGESRIGMGMRDAIDEAIERMAQGQPTGSPAQSAFDDLLEGRDAYRRAEALDTLSGETGLLTSAERRAATSGTGGNVINTIRQNIRRILDNPNLRRGYTDDELQIMEEIVAGTRLENNLRRLGRLSPTTGGLQLLTNIGAVGAGALSGSGATTAAAMAPFAAGYVGQQAAEHMTLRNTQALMDMIANGAPLPGRGITDPEMRAMITGAAGLVPGLLAD